MWMMLCFLHGRRGPLPTPSPKVSPSSPTNPLSLCPAGEKTEASSSELASCKPLGTQSSGIESEKSQNELKSTAAIRGSTFRAVKTRTCLARFSRVEKKKSNNSSGCQDPTTLRTTSPSRVSIASVTA